MLVNEDGVKMLVVMVEWEGHMMPRYAGVIERPDSFAMKVCYKDGLLLPKGE